MLLQYYTHFWTIFIFFADGLSAMLTLTYSMHMNGMTYY